AGLQLVADVRRAEHAGRKPDERGEHDEHIVEVIHQQIRSLQRPAEEQRHGGDKAEQRGQDVETRGQTIIGQQRERGRRDGGNQQDSHHAVDAHRCSPRKRSSTCTSTVSNRSRMRNRKMPMTMKAMRMENATLISTTSGMPLAPVAARTSPFSSDMKPTT